MSPYTDRAYAFNKQLDKSLAAAEVVLGPQAIRRVINEIFFAGIDGGEQLNSYDKKILQAVLSYVDPKKQIVINTDEFPAGGVILKSEPVNSIIDDELEGYTLIDIKTAIAVAIRDDFTGFVLQALQAKWSRDLTLDDVEKITFHLSTIIQLLK